MVAQQFGVDVDRAAVLLHEFAGRRDLSVVSAALALLDGTIAADDFVSLIDKPIDRPLSNITITANTADTAGS